MLALYSLSLATLCSAFALPHQDVDLYLVQCDKSDPYQLWSLPSDSKEPGNVLIKLLSNDPVDKTPICMNCASDRCHGWTCLENDGNNFYTKTWSVKFLPRWQFHTPCFRQGRLPKYNLPHFSVWRHQLEGVHAAM
jgi:hypothetical protein